MKNTNAFSPCLLLWFALVSLGLSSPTVAEAADPAPPNIPDISCPPASGTTVNVPAGGDFQAALNAANPGDVIVLAAGATFTGPFTLPNKAGNGPCITIRTSAPDAALPAPGTRMTPEYAAAGVLPKIVSSGSGLPALQTAASAHHFQIIGVEILPANAGAVVSDLVQLGTSTQGSSDVPHHLVFDRVYIHGWPDGTLKRCVMFNGASATMSNSYISDCKVPNQDSQAIAAWNGPGPFRIINNYLEGASENLAFGGGNPSIPNLVPSDIEIRRNHFAKQLAWMSGSWNVKNLFELKNAQRVLVDGNIFEYNWAGAQSGYAILFTPRNDLPGNAPWSVVQDVTFTNNIVRHSAQGVDILGSDNNFPSGVAQRILIKNNLFEDIGGTQWPPGDSDTLRSGNLLQVVIGPQGGPIDLAVKNNTAFHLAGAKGGGNTLVLGTAGGVTPPCSNCTGFVFENNLTHAGEFGIVGGGAGLCCGTIALNGYLPADYVYQNNVIIGPWPTPGGSRICDFPQGGTCTNPDPTYYPQNDDAVGFTDLANGNYRLAATSPYKNAGTDGRDIGVDWDQFDASILSLEVVNWTSLVRATAVGPSLQKTGGCNGCADAGAASLQTIPSGDGYVQFTASETTTYRAIGLSNGNPGTSVTEIAYALFLNPTGAVSVYELGTYKADTPYVTGDVFRIAVVGNQVQYSKNGVVFYTSTVLPTYPLLVDTSLWSLNATLTNAVISSPLGPQSVVWTSLVNVQANSLKKTSGCNGCADAGAASSQTIITVNGYVEFTASETTTYRAIGLSNGNPGTSVTEIAYALFLNPTGAVSVYEQGTYKADTPYVTGDVFRIAVVGNQVQYSKNGVVFYTSSTPPTYPLLVDTSLWTLNAILNNAVISKGP